jgi:hypothetical protein
MAILHNNLHNNLHNSQTVENQALERFVMHLCRCIKTRPPSPPTRPAPWHDFCSQKPDFFYTFMLNHNMHNKNHQTLEKSRVWFIMQVVMQVLCKCYANLTVCKKHTTIKPSPYPTPYPLAPCQDRPAPCP